MTKESSMVESVGNMPILGAGESCKGKVVITTDSPKTENMTSIALKSTMIKKTTASGSVHQPVGRRRDAPIHHRACPDGGASDHPPADVMYTCPSRFVPVTKMIRRLELRFVLTNVFKAVVVSISVTGSHLFICHTSGLFNYLILVKSPSMLSSIVFFTIIRAAVKRISISVGDPQNYMDPSPNMRSELFPLTDIDGLMDSFVDP
jgi:hypothetical protein